MNYTIKETCEDFQVHEILDTSILSEKKTAFILCTLKKTNYTTERAVHHIANALSLPRKNIGYAGAKDKNAVTTQYITVRGSTPEKISSLQLKDIELHAEGFAHKELSLGNLTGNTFRIVVKHKGEITEKPFSETFSVPNYFDDQRFSNKNFEIGLAILQNDFKQAANLLIESDQDHKEAIQTHLEKHHNDYVGAIKRLPRKTMLFFVHSVQSRLFNELLTQEIKNQDYVEDTYSQGKLAFPKKLQLQTSQETLPLLGWDSQGYEQLLEQYNLNPRSFIVRSIPELSLEETQRKKYLDVTNFSIEYKEHNTIVKFNLGKGSYATIVLRQLFTN